MAFDSLRDFLTDLEHDRDLVRIGREVSRDLEITEITQRVLRSDGPALLFEKVKGAEMPVLMNLLGSTRRITRALGGNDLEETAARISNLVRLRPPTGIVAAIRDLGTT